jgi:hypothetical protein
VILENLTIPRTIPETLHSVDVAISAVCIELLGWLAVDKCNIMQRLRFLKLARASFVVQETAAGHLVFTFHKQERISTCKMEMLAGRQ